MWANRVMSQIRCGPGGLPHVVRPTHKSPESIPTPRALHVSSTPGATPEEGSIATNYCTSAAAIGKGENSQIPSLLVVAL
jgi:hypothetical protein